MTPSARRTLFFALLALALAALLLPMLFFGTTETIVVEADGTSTYIDASDNPLPSWLVRAGSLLAPLGLLLAVGLLFLPFRRSQRKLPVFFRAYVFVPLLFALWLAGGCLYPFSPDQLTRGLPDFLLGANDWGVGNIYVYTKLADWLALLAGCRACARLVPGVLARVRACFPHLLAAFAFHFFPAVICGTGYHAPLRTDLFLLFLWLLAGFAAIALFQSLAADADAAPRRRWLVLSWLAALAWLFVPVACSRP